MTKYNSNFELTIEDVDLIENALRLSKQMLDDTARTTPSDPQHDTLNQIQDLLGRLHNQKVFFRPRTGSYVSG